MKYFTHVDRNYASNFTHHSMTNLKVLTIFCDCCVYGLSCDCGLNCETAILPHHYVIRRSREIVSASSAFNASASSAFNAWLAPLEEGCLYVCTNCNSLILRRTTGR